MQEQHRIYSVAVGDGDKGHRVVGVHIPDDEGSGHFVYMDGDVVNRIAWRFVNDVRPVLIQEKYVSASDPRSDYDAAVTATSEENATWLFTASIERPDHLRVATEISFPVALEYPDFLETNELAGMAVMSGFQIIIRNLKRRDQKED